MHDTIVNSLYCGHCWDLESVSSLTSVRNSGSFFSVKRLLFVFAGDLAAVRFTGMYVIAGCPQGESWLYYQILFKKSFKISEKTTLRVVLLYIFLKKIKT